MQDASTTVQACFKHASREGSSIRSLRIPALPTRVVRIASKYKTSQKIRKLRRSTTEQASGPVQWTIRLCCFLPYIQVAILPRSNVFFPHASLSTNWAPVSCIHSRECLGTTASQSRIQLPRAQNALQSPANVGTSK